jgi:hypothetical protein
VKGEEFLLPTEISGMTDIFKPGKPWFKNFQQRYGDQTDYDAVQGFAGYLEGIGRVIFLTDDIQRIDSLRRPYAASTAQRTRQRPAGQKQGASPDKLRCAAP